MSIRSRPRLSVGALSFPAVVTALACVSSALVGSHAEQGPPAPGATRQAARRIVSLAPNITEVLFALGIGDRVVGVTDYCNYPPETAHVRKVGGFVDPSPEAILALGPDLVVATPNVGNRSLVERVMATGARVEIVQARNVEEIFPAIEAIAVAAGVPEQGRSLISRTRGALDAQKARVAALPRRRVLFCLQIDPLLAAGRGSYPGDLVDLAGGENIVPRSAGSYPRFSLEEVIRSAPDAIVQSLMDTRSGASGAEALRAYWLRYPSIPAVRTKRVFTIEGDLVLRPGPRVAQGVGALIDLLHPEAAK